MKHKISKRVFMALAVCVACALALGTTLAWADIDSNMGGTNKLQVSVADPETDVRNASPQVSVYKVASASKDGTYDTYNYTFDVEAFAELGTGFDQASMTADSWQKMAEAAKGIVEKGNVTPNATAAAGDTITNLQDGIYLVLIPDAQSPTNTFSFTPALVSVPGKVGADGSPVYNTSEGRWTNTDPVATVPLVAKWSMTPRKGSLQINKITSGFSGEAATFVFHIVDTETGGQKYENYAAVQYTAEGVQSATVNNIPAGMELTVTEVDSGARYQTVGEASTTTTIVGDTTVEVNFENEPNGSAHGGHGIENHFVFDEDLNGGDWQLEVRAIDASEVVNS